MGPWGWRVLGAAVRGTEGAGAYSWGEAQHGSLPCAPGLHPQECSVQPGGRGGAGGAGAVPGSLRNGGLQGRGSSSPRCYGGGRAKESSPGRGSWCPLPCHSLHPAFGPRAVSLPPSSASAPPTQPGAPLVPSPRWPHHAAGFWGGPGTSLHPCPGLPPRVMGVSPSPGLYSLPPAGQARAMPGPGVAEESGAAVGSLPGVPAGTVPGSVRRAGPSARMGTAERAPPPAHCAKARLTARGYFSVSESCRMRRSSSSSRRERRSASACSRADSAMASRSCSS